MTRNTKGQGVAAPREDRLKSALKANLARRKAQARARDKDAGGTTETTEAVTKEAEQTAGDGGTHED